jgi:hypothetical protein
LTNSNLLNLQINSGLIEKAPGHMLRTECKDLIYEIKEIMEKRLLCMNFSTKDISRFHDFSPFFCDFRFFVLHFFVAQWAIEGRSMNAGFLSGI